MRGIRRSQERRLSGVVCPEREGHGEIVNSLSDEARAGLLWVVDGNLAFCLMWLAVKLLKGFQALLGGV
jgi:hypothetical protein